MKCSANVPKNGKALNCIVCGLWCHLKCVVPSMSDETYNYFVQTNEQFGSTGWSCVNCNSGFKKLTGIVSELQKKVSAAESNIDKNAQNIEQHGLKVQVLEGKVESMEKICNNKELIERAVADKSKEWSKELHDREARKGNLLIHNVKEAGPDCTTSRAKREHDNDFIIELCNITETTCCVDTDIKFLARTGEKPKDGKPRPIIVGFRDVSIRDGIINGAYKLKGSSLDYIRVVPDLTKMQRNDEQALYAEAEKRNESLTGEDLNFQWLVVGPKGAKRLQKARKTERTRKRPNSRSPPNPRNRQNPRRHDTVDQEEVQQSAH